MSQAKVVTITVDNAGQQADAQLSHEEAMALAQLVKRLTWNDMRGCAVDDAETYVIRDAVGKLQDALGRAGYAPR
ncbi:hypothetical protein [Pseudomonas sp. R5(2019)]|uniref:DUF7706 family protein n=1 Tax=Pseudomonas sp. R5(2019) TaxID=2697566 RepID=UPI001412DB76|nr:hypothetical protein [Pseudomonas sp. R5(2019)]NBA95257.1 hypothetical protein [Pseudomonas sp. R5(2019)]